MNSFRFVLIFIEKIGLLNPYREELRWKKQLQNVYRCVQTFSLCLFACLHLQTTITKCLRYTPEFFESLFEDTYFIGGCLAVIYLVFNQASFYSIYYFKENSFSKAYTQTVQTCEHNCKLLIMIIFFLNVSSELMNIMDSLMPLPEEELEIRRMVYQTNHPTRRLPYHMVFPFKDEVGIWEFALFTVCLLYITTLYAGIISLATTVLPIAVLQLKCQYQILASCIEKIGLTHVDSHGNEIFYLNIVHKETCLVPIKGNDGKKFDRETLLKRRRNYELFYIKQIVQHHQKLVIFQDKVRVPSFLYIF